MTTRARAVLVLASGLLVAGCTAPVSTGEVTATPAADPGPLSAVPADGAGPVPSLAVFGMAVSGSGVPAMLYDAVGADSPPSTARLGVGPDPAVWTPVSPADVESGQSIGTLVVGDDGSVTALAVVDTPDAFGLHVLRVAPDGSQTAARIAGAEVGYLSSATVDAVSDDGRTAVVVALDPLGTDPSVADPAAVDRIDVLTVDLATATVTAQTTTDLGTGVAPALLDVAVDAAGAVSVLLGRAPGDESAPADGAELARFGPGLAYRGLMLVDAAARSLQTRFDLTADGTALVTYQPTLPEDRLSTRVVSIAAGSTEVVPVTDLDGTTVSAIVAGPAGWAHLEVGDVSARTTAVLPLDLATGEPADPVGLCAGGEVADLVRSGSGDTLLTRVLCRPDDVRLFVLTGR